MKVKAVKSFVSRLPNGKTVSVSFGDTLTMPKGADWLKAGLVKKIVTRKSRITNKPE